MTQEEKARAYDEALETARKINSGEGVAAPPDWTICEVIFPELKESGGEKVRKALINLFKTENFNGYTTLNGIDVDDVITWLEKQGEQRSKLVDFDYNAKDSDLQEVTYFIPNGFHAEMDGNKVVIKQGEQKPAWSEEDELLALSIEHVMNCASLLNIVPEKVDKIRTWIKSLKQRMEGSK